MGIDVEFYVEYKLVPEGPWIGLGEFSVDRDRTLNEALINFGGMKGIPSDWSISLFEKIYSRVVQEFEMQSLIGEKFCTEHLVEKWKVKYGSSIYHCDNTGYDYILDPECVNASWLSSSDFFKCMESDSFLKPPGIDVLAVLAAAKCIEERLGSDTVRIVFWFN